MLGGVRARRCTRGGRAAEPRLLAFVGPTENAGTRQRRIVMSIGVVVAVVLGTITAVGAQTHVGDFVTGSGTLQVHQPPLAEPVPFVFDVHAGPSGEDPTGVVTIGEFFVGAPVSCLAIRVLPTNPPVAAATINVLTSAFGLVTIEVVDGTPEGIPDSVSSDLNSSRSPSDCSPLSFAEQETHASVLAGAIAIGDAAAGPTSTAECKRGGWQRFAGFDRQGDCLRFVRRRRPA